MRGWLSLKVINDKVCYVLVNPLTRLLGGVIANIFWKTKRSCDKTNYSHLHRPELVGKPGLKSATRTPCRRRRGSPP